MQQNQKGFTLIELMIALTISTAIVLVATSAFNTVTKAVTKAKQMSLETSLLQEGYIAALNEADFWYAMDDPWDQSGQPQRVRYEESGSNWNTLDDATDYNKTDESTVGQPFAPIDLDGTGTQATSASAPAVSSTDSLYNGFVNWRIADPRTWDRNGYTYINRYGSMAVASSVASITGGNFDLTNDDAAWLPTLKDRLQRRGGTYLLLDYLPNSSPPGYFLAHNGINSFGDQVAMGNHETSDDLYPAHLGQYALSKIPSNSQVFDLLAYSTSSLLRNKHVLLIAPRGFWARNPGGQDKDMSTNGSNRASFNDHYAIQSAQRLWLRDVNNSYQEYDINTHLGGVMSSNPSFQIRPPEWPSVTLGVYRYMDVYKRGQRVEVTLQSPVTGAQQRLSFRTMTTTLRGARMQREWDHYRPSGTSATAAGWDLEVEP